ncbi:MAG: rRNA maturation RNase YbeY [Actinomycetota bacterium]
MSDDPLDTNVLLSNRQEMPVDEEGLRELATSCLKAEGRQEAELSVSFVTLDEMAGLHERYMSEPGPTDVLSFPMDAREEETQVLGDVVIAPEFAAGNNSDLRSELRLLLVHGILHLLGYDHEDDADRATMWERQERYTGVAVP